MNARGIIIVQSEPACTPRRIAAIAASETLQNLDVCTRPGMAEAIDRSGAVRFNKVRTMAIDVSAEACASRRRLGIDVHAQIL